MATQKPIALIDYLSRNVGRDLRSIIHYGPESYSIAYIREDVEDSYTDEHLNTLVNELRLENIESLHQEYVHMHESLRCSVRCFKKGVEMHFPHQGQTGTAISMETKATENLYDFVGDCLTILNSYSDGTVGVSGL